MKFHLNTVLSIFVCATNPTLWGHEDKNKFRLLYFSSKHYQIFGLNYKISL